MKKKFLLLDSTVNDYGFRMIPSGVDLSRFNNNPVVLYVHKDTMLPIGKGIVTLENGSLFVEVEFDMEDEESKRIAGKVERGFLKGVSGGYDVIELSTDPGDLIPGQQYPTVTKSLLNEISIAPIPANKNSLALGKSNSGIKLSTEMTDDHIKSIFIQPKPISQISMKKVTDLLGLSADATEDQIANAISQIQLSKKTADEAVAGVLKAGESQFKEEKQKNFYIELSKNNPKAALDFLELNKEEKTDVILEEGTTKTVADIIKDGKVELSKKAADAPEANPLKGDKTCYDYLSRNEPEKLRLMKSSNPNDFQKLVDDYKKGVRFQA